MIRAIRLELAKPLDEPWDVVGPCLRLLAKATPKLLNAAMDARIAIEVAGRDAVKAKIAPGARAASAEGLAYQAVLRKEEQLRAWGAKKKLAFASLDVPGAMASAISRAASQAYARRDQGRARFASERILVRGDGVKVSKDDRGVVLALKLATKGSVRFACAHSRGARQEAIDAIARGELPHGDCKLQRDNRGKWYALLSYEPAEPAPMTVDPSRVLAVHRGVRNALYTLSSTGERLPFPGAKFFALRRRLRARMAEIRRVSQFERGSGSRGHGKSRRYESYSALEDKLARATHTFCQQAAAFVVARALHLGCGLVVIEDYGGLEPDEDATRRRLLDRGPLYQLKECISHACERGDGERSLTLRETSSAYISTTCPRCGEVDPRAHNFRTGIFHCRACVFERPADWVAAFWMLDRGGADMTEWRERLRREREMAEQLKAMEAMG